MMKVEFLRVLGIRSKEASVLATADGHLVTWNPRRGWNCKCLSPLAEFECDHIVEVKAMLDDKVLTPLRSRAGGAA